MLNGTYISVRSDLIQWSIDASKSFTPNKAEMRFLNGGMCGQDMATVDEKEPHAFTKIYAYLLVPGIHDYNKKPILYVKVLQSEGEGSGMKIHLLKLEDSPFSMAAIASNASHFISLLNCANPPIETVDTKIEYGNFLEGHSVFFVGKNPATIAKLIKRDYCDVVSNSFLEDELPNWVNSAEKRIHPEKTERKSNAAILSSNETQEFAKILGVTDINKVGGFIVLHSIGHMSSKEHSHSRMANKPFTKGIGFMASGAGVQVLMTKSNLLAGWPNWTTRPNGFQNLDSVVIGLPKSPIASSEKAKTTVCDYLSN